MEIIKGRKYFSIEFVRGYGAVIGGLSFILGLMVGMTLLK